MKFNKKATTVEEQADTLIKRGLISENSDELKRYLSDVGYYRLSAYWLPFEAPPEEGKTRSKKFPKNTTFDDILKVYIFDRNLRLIVMEAIERIEIKLRSRWTNMLTLKYGAHGYMEYEHFANPWKHIERLNRLSQNIRDSEEVFNKHYKKKYTKPFMPPLWVVCETMTLTEISKFIVDTKDNKVKDKLAKELGLPNKEVMAGTIHCLCYVRNICAHHGRLWNRRLVKRVPKIKNFRDDFVYADDNPNEPTNYLYNVLVTIIYLVCAENNDTSYPSRLLKLLETINDNARMRMGFPKDWRERQVWQRAAKYIP